MKRTKLFTAALFAAAWLAGGMAWAQSEPAQDSDGWYLLGTVDDVEWFGQQVMDGKHATIKGKLTADIDYKGVVNRHRPIGHYGQKFVGKFDGQGHRILNMILNDPTLPKGNDDGTGFFGCVRVGGDGFIMGSDTEKETNDLVEIKNLIIDASCRITSSRANTAGLVGRISEKTTNNTVLIENCINEATIVTTANAPAGIVGQINNAADGNVIIRNCVNKGTVTTSGVAAAGIISQVYNCAVKLNIESCMNLADVKSTGNKNCGGIHGENTSSKATIKIINCGNTGNVTGTDESAALTGWIGSKGGNVISNCWNIGTVTGVKGSDNTWRGTVTVTNVYNKFGGQGTAITDEMVASGELCYKLNGDQSVISWYQKLDEDEVPMPMAKEGAIVYQNATYLCPDKTSGDVEYSNANTSVIPPHEYVNGICSICDGFQKPDLVDGWYEIVNAGNVEWFSAKVADGDLTINGKLMKDIDFEKVENIHSPIGPSTAQKFNGTFDGQGFRIKNMIINRPDQDNQGFFGYLRGNNKDTYVKNLIIDSSCSITGKKSVGGIAANGQNNETFIYIQNCVNEANITALGGDAGGILGSSSTNYPKWIIQNCVNTGTITATTDNPYAGGLTGWMGDNGASRIENFINIGTITYMDNNQNIYRGNNINNISALVDLSGTAGATQGIVEGMTPSDLATGKVAYYINNIAGSNVFFQTLEGAYADAYPVPFSTSAIVYEVGDFYCDGTPKGAVAYSNTDASNRDAHITDAETGFCTVCHNLVETWIVPESDGFYHLSTANQVEWFSAMVAAGHGAMKVKLDADIDFGRIENAHTPIGTADKKFFGVFDGQKHRIKGMVLNKEQDGVGFFGHIQAGGTYNDVDYTETSFRNVIVDSSCSVTSTGARCGGLIGRLNGALNDDATLRIEYCGNEANVIAGGQNAGGLMGGIQGTTCKVVVRNCYNTGNITAGMETTALVGWTGNATGENVVVERCWNSGLISNLDVKGRNLYRCPDAGITASCLCDLSETPNATQGQVVINTANPYASGELCYLLNGDQSAITWTQNLGEEEMPNMYGTTSQVYQAGTVDCTGSAVGGISYNNVSGETVQLGHHFDAEIGMCDVCYTQFQEPALVDGYYELKNAGNVEWFGASVAAGNTTINGKLMNDIDFLKIENLHSPIGPNTEQKYNGTFDGQGFRIKNMIIKRPTESNIGFFGFLRGAGTTTIKNLIIDASCSIHGNNRVGGITGSYQVGGGTITIENVINEATITAEHQDAGGIFGGHEASNPTIIIKNVLNTGTITAKDSAPFAGALCCYLGVGAGSKIENFVNLGTVNGHNGGNIGRHNIGDVTNLIDLSDTDNKTQGTDSGLTKDDIANGKLAYTVGWGQLLDTDTDAYPTPLNETKVNYVGDAGYATMYDTANDWALNGDATAYIAAFDGKYLQLTEVEDVPAGAAVILKGSYYNKLATTATSDVIANELRGTDADTPADGTMYVLAQPEGEEVGFYQATGTIAAGKAYYQSTSGVKAFYFGNGDATSIQTIENAQKTTEDAIYNIAGQRLNKVQKGINIINGKKVLY